MKVLILVKRIAEHSKLYVIGRSIDVYCVVKNVRETQCGTIIKNN